MKNATTKQGNEYDYSILADFNQCFDMAVFKGYVKCRKCGTRRDKKEAPVCMVCHDRRLVKTKNRKPYYTMRHHARPPKLAPWGKTAKIHDLLVENGKDRPEIPVEEIGKRFGRAIKRLEEV